jgi:hypothetical protein
MRPLQLQEGDAHHRLPAGGPRDPGGEGRMTRRDLIANEIHQAVTYEREAKSRRTKNPALADQMVAWADASRKRAEQMRCGPLFGGRE